MKFVFPFLLICSFKAYAFDSDFFLRSKPCLEQDFSKLKREKTLDMCWNFSDKSHFRFVSSNQEIYFEIYLGKLPENYQDFLDRIRPNFEENESGQLIYSYKLKSSGREERNAFSVSNKETHPDEYSYIVSDRRIFKRAQPTQMNQSTLGKIIKSNQVLFYTGAGLSLASKVPAMDDLNDLLGIEAGEGIVFSLEGAIASPREFAEKIRSFHNACVNSPPTPAHIALRDLCLAKNIRMVTENLDCLHEASGVFPYRVDAQHLREHIGGQALRHVDYVICIGLSFDDHGFLGWYKKQNPQGRIIAVDVHQPTYLGDEDFWVQGDLQVLLPEIGQQIDEEQQL